MEKDTKFVSFPVTEYKVVASNLYALHGVVDALSRNGRKTKDCVDGNICRPEQIHPCFAQAIALTSGALLSDSRILKTDSKVSFMVSNQLELIPRMV